MHPNVVGRVSRMCLSLGVVPVFAPVAEQGFQGMIENYNGNWQAKVWARFRFGSLREVEGQSRRFVTALRATPGKSHRVGPDREAFPKAWKLNLQEALRGRMIYLRRTDESGTVEMLGQRLVVDRLWPHRLVRAEVDLDRGVIRFYRLRTEGPERRTDVEPDQASHSQPEIP